MNPHGAHPPAGSGGKCPFSTTASMLSGSPTTASTAQPTTKTATTAKKGKDTLSSWLTLRNLQILMVILTLIFASATYVMYTMLAPILLSSTSPIAQINGDNLAKDSLLAAEHYLEDAVTGASHHDSQHHHHTPKPQFSVKYRTETNPAVKDLDPMYRADTAMAAKFRSLVPNKIRIWYDDHRGGLENGHLTLGQVRSNPHFLLIV